ncbi:coiled-coil domain-containing protein [Epilithonimonas caeni]|uniref:hypothetical protein n=1 Tax=Epilithonimonas caeni TaxID=365343 RepID=UPI000487268A|nr:hypothetical protein [Epilithonimonas caeni]
MAKEVSFPGLKEHIKEVSELTEEMKKLLKISLDIAVMKEEEAKQYTKSTISIKNYLEVQEKTKKIQKEADENDKKVINTQSALEKAKARLKTAMDNEAKQIASVNLQIARQNQLNKENAKLNEEGFSALEKLNAQISKYTREAKDLGAQLVLLKQEGKETTEEYKNIEKQFEAASAKSSQLNADYRALSKASGDNRALVGSYSEELEGHFSKLGDNINGLMDNLASGNILGVINQGREVAIGFQQGYQVVKDTISSVNETLVNGAKNMLGFGSASQTVASTQVDLAAAEELVTVATNEQNISQETAIGFRTSAAVANTELAVAEGATTIATITSTEATIADTIATEANTVSNIEQAISEEASTASSVAETLATEAQTVAHVELAASENISTVAIAENTTAEAASIVATNTATNSIVRETAALNAETASLNRASVASGQLATGQIGVAAASETAAVAEGTAATATGILNIAMGILLAPITLVILAVGALIYIFKQFTPIVDIVEQAIAGISAAFNVVKNSIIGLVTGTKSLSEAFSGLAGDMRDAAAAAAELKKAQQDLEDNMEGQSIQNSKIQGQIEALIIQSKDRTKSEEQRLAALKKAEELEKQNYAQRIALAKEDLRIAEQVILQKAGITKKEEAELRKRYTNENDFYNAFKSLAESRTTSVDEEFTNFKESLSGYYEVLNEHNKFTEKTVNANNKIIEKGEADREKMEKKREEEAKKAKERMEKAQKEAEDHSRKIIELAINKKKAEIDSLISGYDQTNHLQADNIKFIEDISARKMAISQLEMSKDLIGLKVNKELIDEKIKNNRKLSSSELDYLLIKQKYADNEVKINNDKENGIKKVNNDNSKFELELYDAKQKSLLEGVTSLTDDLVNAEKDRIKQVYEVHQKALEDEFKLDQEKIDEKVKNNEKLTEAETKFYIQSLKLKKDFDKDTKEIDKKSQEYKLKVIDDEEKRNIKNFKQKTKDSNAQKANELSEERKSLNSKLALYKAGSKEEIDINEKLKDNNFYINQLIKDSKIESLNSGLDFFINIAGEESKLGKALATLKVTMDTYEKASSAFNTGHLLASNPVTAALAPNAYLQGGLIIAGGLLKVSQINGISLFAEGSDFVPYTGLAIKDELGPELHLNRFGKIKSWGSDQGAHFEQVEIGDKIIPADITAMIRETAFAEPLRRIQILDFNNTNVDSRIDYEMIGNEFGKHASKIVGAIKNNKTNITINNNRGQDFYNRVRHVGKKV